MGDAGGEPTLVGPRVVKRNCSWLVSIRSLGVQSRSDSPLLGVGATANVSGSARLVGETSQLEKPGW